MSAVLLKVDQLSKIYAQEGDKVLALEDVSFSLSEGETLAIMGPSGSGKSTLLHLIGALESPSKGEVYFRDAAIFRYKPDERAVWRNRHVGFVFQFHHLLGEFSALENVAMPLLISGMSREESLARARVLLSDLRLDHRVDHLPSALSGGERQRVAMARALVGNPDLLLADEPTGSLDHEQGEHVLNYLLATQRSRGMSLVMVTHNAEIAARLSRTLTIRDGKLL